MKMGLTPLEIAPVLEGSASWRSGLFLTGLTRETLYASILSMRNIVSVGALFITVFSTVLLPFGISTVFAGNPAPFSAAGTGSETIQLSWTTDVDITAHEARYSTSPIDGSNYNSGTAVSSMPPGGIPNAAQNVTVSGLAHSTTYYFVYRYEDSVGDFAVSTASATTQ